MPPRIQKYLAHAGVASRREIERWIEQGRIEIDGRPARLGDQVQAGTQIRIDGRPARLGQNQYGQTRVLLYHKPAKEICSRFDPKGRVTVFDCLPRLRFRRWVSIGRLDFNTTGLLLFTDDGGLAHRLMHPSSEIEREYRCRLRGEVDNSIIQHLCHGVRIGGQLLSFDTVRRERASGSHAWFSVVLREGRYREVRRLWRAVGCEVSRLIRVRFGPVVLPRDLPPGAYRELDGKLKTRLIHAAGRKRGRDAVPGR